MKFMRDYFGDLGLERDANLEEVRKAYKKLARLFHPDIAPNRADEFSKVQEAYEQLRSQTRIEKIRGNLSSAKSNSLLNSYLKVKNSSPNPVPAEVATRIEKLDQRIVAVIETRKKPGDQQEVTWSVEELCTKCRGRGGNPGIKKIQCGPCRGLGYQLIQRGASFRWKKTCETCHGLGYEIKDSCVECQGYGKVATLQKKVFQIPKDVSGSVCFEGLGHHSFDGKSRGLLWIQWTKKI